MDRRLIFAIVVVGVAIVTWAAFSFIHDTGQQASEKSMEKFEKAADTAVTDKDREDIGVKDRGLGAAHKKKAFDYSKKAHDRTGDYFEKHAGDMDDSYNVDEE